MPPQTPPPRGRALRSPASSRKSAREHADERRLTDASPAHRHVSPPSKEAFVGSSSPDATAAIPSENPTTAISTNAATASASTPAATVPDRRLILALRSAVVLMALACYGWRDVIQGGVDGAWRHLRDAWWFRTVYFESAWATVTYAYVIALYPFAMHYLPWLDRYKVDKTTTYVHQTVGKMLLEAVVYVTPLGLMDTFMVKRYCGVDPAQWAERAQHVIQTTRALPVDPPTLGRLCYEVIGSVIIYDLMFFFFHLALHRFRPLYTLFHATHHDHDVMHAHVTNQLSVGERVALILMANQALKILYSHPLSRALFVPVFVFLLVDNHTGYDLPWGLQHLVPAGLFGGPRLHHAHHALSTRHYQPFLTYMDSALQWWEGRGCYRKQL